MKENFKDFIIKDLKFRIEAEKTKWAKDYNSKNILTILESGLGNGETKKIAENQTKIMAAEHNLKVYEDTIKLLNDLLKSESSK